MLNLEPIEYLSSVRDVVKVLSCYPVPQTALTATNENIKIKNVLHNTTTQHNTQS